MQEDELIKDAAEVIGGDEEILAAAIFGLQDDYGKIFVAGVATAATTDALGVDGSMAHAAAAGATVHEARRLNAEDKGVTVRMLVAVTPSSIHVLDRTELGKTSRELMKFERKTTTVQITKFGLSRKLNLADEADDKRIDLTGSTAVFSPEAAGDKLVLHLLAEPS